MNLSDTDTVRLIQASESEEEDVSDMKIVQVMKLKVKILPTIFILIVKKCIIKKEFSPRTIK